MWNCEKVTRWASWVAMVMPRQLGRTARTSDQAMRVSRPRAVRCSSMVWFQRTFVKSPPAEAVWIGYYAAVNGYDGFLRWAWTTWPENPLRDTTYWGHPYEHYLPAGDTFLIYPGPRGAMRWEMLRDGIEENEKLAVIRAAHDGKWPDEIMRALEIFRDPKKMRDDESVMNDVMKMREILERESRTLR